MFSQNWGEGGGAGPVFIHCKLWIWYIGGGPPNPASLRGPSGGWGEDPPSDQSYQSGPVGSPALRVQTDMIGPRSGSGLTALARVKQN